MEKFTEIHMTPLEAELIDGKNIRYLFSQFAGILQIRSDLYSYYNREDKIMDAVVNPEDAPVFASIAKYAVDIATGYFIGKPCKYYNRITTTVKKMEMVSGGSRSVLKEKNIIGDDDNVTAQENAVYMSVYRAILRRNHEDEENIALTRDALVHRTAFERIYVTKDPEDGHPDIRFTTMDPKKCVLIRDTTVERNPVAFICKEDFIDPFTNRGMQRYELITKERHMFYEFYADSIMAGEAPHGVSQQDVASPIKEYPASDEDLNLLRLVGIPVIEYEMPDGKAFFEDVIPLINARDALLNNMKNTFKYNDEAILLLTGYMKPQTEEEEARMKDSISKFKTMYLGDDNKVEWLLKDVPIESFQGYYTILSSDIFAILGIKNPVKTSEVYQNITTVRYQNYGMDNTVLGLERVFERSLLEGRARIITKILNYLNDKEWDWEILDVSFDRNLPSSRVEEAQFIAHMKGANILSDRDILDQVQFVEDSDAAVARKRIQDEEEARLLADSSLNDKVNPYVVKDKDNIENDRKVDNADGRVGKAGQSAVRTATANQ